VAEIRAKLTPGTPIEVWCQDEMRVGQKNKLTYRWARKGSRPRATHDQRTQSTYLFGAVCPERGTGAALVLPACNTEAMQLHLDEIANKVTPGAHAIVLLDQAGWHGKHLADAATGPSPRAQRSGKHLAIHEAKLALQSGLQMLRRYRRPLLLCLEHPDRSALENHVRRSPRLGHRGCFIMRMGIMHAKRNTLEGDRLDVLVALVEAWEAKHYPLICPIQSKQLNTTWSRKD
jgi:DDE superfamily endonuclease